MFENTNQEPIADSPIFIQSIVKEQNWNNFLNLVFSQGSEQEVLHFFESLSELQKDNYRISEKTQLFFQALYSTLIYIRQNDAFYFDFDIFLSYLNIDTLHKVYKTRKDLAPSIKRKILNLFESIDGYDDSSAKQIKSFIFSANIVSQQIKNIFLSTSNLMVDSDFLFFCDQFIQKYQNKIQNDNLNLLNHIIYQNKITPENRDKIINLLTEYQKPQFKTISDFNFNELIKSIYQKKEAQFLQQVDFLVEYYKADSGITELTNEDKIKIFFSPYLKKFTNIYENFIELLLANYQEKLFNRIFEVYSLPINCPIRFEKDEIIVEEKDDKVIKKFVKKINYYNITEYCLENGLSHIAIKLFKQFKDSCFSSFEIKTIENDTIYHYNYQFLKSYVTKKEEHVNFLIENKCIDNTTKLFYKNEDGTIVYENIFYYLIFHEYYQTFNSLLEISFQDNFDIKQITNQHDDSMFLFFIKNIFDKIEKKKTLVNYSSFCSQIQTYGISLFYKPSQAEKIRQYLAEIGKMSLPHLVYLSHIMQPFFQNTWTIKTTDIHLFNKNIIKLEQTNKKITWFNRPNLELHLEKLSQQKDSSNIPTILHMLQKDNHMKDNLFVKDEIIFETLEKEFPNFKEVIDFYKGQFRIKSLSNKINVEPVLLLGPPGIGKTYFAKKLSEYLKTGYTFLDLGAMSAKWILSGANGTWKDAKQGKILDSIINSPTINPVIVMDELDKARGGDYDPTVVLYQLLEEINAKEFTDEFIDFPFNASGIIYIACANDAYKLSEPLLSRFKIFQIDLPNDHQFEKIIQYIYKDITTDSKVFSPTVSPDIINLLKGKSMRNIKSIVQDAVNKAILEIDFQSIKGLPFATLELKLKHFSNLYEKRVIGF